MKTAAKWIRNVTDEYAIKEGCYFDEAAGNRPVTFFEKYLRHSTGRWAGKPFILLPWQRDNFIVPLFGWKRADGTRRFRLAYVQIAKKNGKSALCSGIALYLEIGDGEASAQVFLAAADKEQASIVYDECAKMVRASPSLSNKLDVIDSRKRIIFGQTNSVIRVLSRESKTSEGINLSGLVFDELHAQSTRELWDSLRYGGSARSQPLIVSITTAGYDKHSICYEQYDYAKKVQAGIIEDSTFFPLIYEPAEKDDWTKLESWNKANPSMNETIDLTTFKTDFKEAKEAPTKENSFKRYRLNMWTEQDVRWLQMEKWDACKGERTLDELKEAMKGRPCYAGLDMSNVSDVSAFGLIFPEDGNVFLPFFWIPKGTAEYRERKHRVPYATWVRTGLMRATEGNQVDYATVRRDINEIAKDYKIIEIGADPWNCTQLITELGEQDGFKVVEFRQGYASLSAPSKELERLVGSSGFVHGGDPVLRWMASNVCTETDAAGNIKPSKDKSSEKIDGIVSLIVALGCAMVRTKVDSIYEHEGLKTL